MNKELSRLIYQELINGWVINKLMMDGDLMVPNPLYDELSSSLNREHYEQLYSYIGYELKEMGGCFFLNELSKSDVLSIATMRIQAMLVILVRGTTQLPLLTSVVTTHQAGLTRDQVEKIGTNDEYHQIMRAVGLKDCFEKEVEKILITRKLAYWNHRDRLVLTSGGVSLLDRMQLEIEATKALEEIDGTL
ncbi:condensin complex protein MksE [Microbulbifer sp. JMSA003]|uniref:condensin complex protein MksE n=1 Tax=Microbulbifer sp. JMSA003 TaxID=3243369 RepID=UPI00403A736C